MAPDIYIRGLVPLPREAQDGGWGRRPEPEPELPLRLGWIDYWCCFLCVFLVCLIAARFRGFLLDDEYSVVNVVVLLLTKTHLLVMKMKSSPAPSSTWTALAVLPTCPAPALDLPPVCYEWEKPASSMVLPGSGSADNNWRTHEQIGDYKAARKCFDSLVRDAAWTCDEQEDDYKAAMKCFNSVIRDEARICFVWSYDAIPLTPQSDDPPPT